MVAGDKLAVATATGAFGDKNAGAQKTVQVTGLSLAGADAGNYDIGDHPEPTFLSLQTVAPLTIT
jgi:hypothetical protein